MGTRAGLLVAVLPIALATGCGAFRAQPPTGMRFVAARVHDRDEALEELARVQPGEGERVLAVVYPRSACSATASAVVLDADGRFLGAVAPGTAALLPVPERLRAVTLVSSVEVTAPAGSWHVAHHVAVPEAPGGLLLRSWRWTARECGSGAYFEVRHALKPTLEEELGDSAVRWVTLERAEGQAWIDSHRPRVVELLTTPPTGRPGDLSHILVR